MGGAAHDEQPVAAEELEEARAEDIDVAVDEAGDKEE